MISTRSSPCVYSFSWCGQLNHRWHTTATSTLLYVSFKIHDFRFKAAMVDFILNRVCSFSPCLFWFSLGTPASSHASKGMQISVVVIWDSKIDRRCDWLFVSVCWLCDSLVTFSWCNPASRPNVSWDWLLLPKGLSTKLFSPWNTDFWKHCRTWMTQSARFYFSPLLFLIQL